MVKHLRHCVEGRHSKATRMDCPMINGHILLIYNPYDLLARTTGEGHFSMLKTTVAEC